MSLLGSWPNNGVFRWTLSLQTLLYILIFCVAAKAWSLYSAWARRERILSKSIKIGPAFFEGLRAMAAKQSHRENMGFIKKYGSIFALRFLNEHVVMVTNPTLIAEILRNTSCADKTKKLYECLSIPFSDKGKSNLLSHETDDQWQLVRKAIMPAFSIGALKQAFPAIQEVLAHVVEVLKQRDGSQPLNMSHVLGGLSLDILGRVAFETDMGGVDSLKSEEATTHDKLEITHAAMDEVFLILIERGLRYYRFWDADVRKGKRAITDFQRMTRRLLEDLKARKDLSPDSVAGRLLATRDPATCQPLHDDLVHPEISIIFLAGFETTSNAMGWTLYCISQHPEVERRIQAELAEAGLLACEGNPHPRPVQWEDIGKLRYLEAVIKESNRLYNVTAAGTAREALSDILVGGRYIIPKGTLIFIPFFATYRSEENWEEPDSFLPDRFLVEDADVARSGQFSLTPEEQKVLGSKPVKRYIPFSEGARNCAGMSLAKLSMPAVLATLLSRFRFRLADKMGGPEGVRKAEKLAVTLSIEGGLWMHCIPRV